MSLFQASSLYELHIVTLILGGGLFAFVISLLLLIIFFGWSLNKVLKNVTLMALFLVLVASIPITGYLLASPTETFLNAKEKVEVFNLSINRIDERNISVSYNTSKPATSYLEVKLSAKSIKPVFPDYNLKPINYHVFVIQTDYYEKGTINIIINGELYSTQESLQIP